MSSSPSGDDSALENRRSSSSAGDTPPDSSPITKDEYGAPGTHGIGFPSPVQQSVDNQDLSDDKLLLAAPRMTFNGQVVPALGGIPMLARVGRGGMGSVYYGINTRLKRECAVKVLPFELAEKQPELIQRFYREARLAASVNSPHLVSVWDVNEQKGLFYLVMEFVNGKTAGLVLKNFRDMGKPGLNESDALDLCIAATKGMAASHMLGIIHRDIKPDNILVPRGGKTGLDFNASKLTDLGLAREALTGEDQAEVSHLTQTQVTMGTPGFLSPEQAMDARTVGKPADIFSMGATLYALLTGTAPFHEASPIKSILATIQKPHMPIEMLRPELSMATCELIERCLIKDPDKRYVDGTALLEAMKVARGAVNKPEHTQVTAIDQIKALVEASEVGRPVLHGDEFEDLPIAPSIPAQITSVAAAAVSGPRPEGAGTQKVTAETQRNLSGQVPASRLGYSVAEQKLAARRGSGRAEDAPPVNWLLRIALVAIVTMMLSGAVVYAVYLYAQRNVGEQQAEIRKVLDGLQNVKTMTASPETVEQSIARLNGLPDAYPHVYAEHKDEIAALRTAFENRARMLRDRKQYFDSRLVEVEKLLREDKEEEAYPKILVLMSIGSSKGDPDLIMESRLPQLLKDVDKIRLRKQRLKEFADVWQKASELAKKSEAENRDKWEELRRILKPALDGVEASDHPNKLEALALLKQADEEHERRVTFEFHWKTGVMFMDNGWGYGPARDSFRKALQTWPNSPDAERVENLRKDAVEKLFRSEVAKATEALTTRRLDEAERIAKELLAERSTEPSVLAILDAVRSKRDDEKVERLLADAAARLKATDLEGAAKKYKEILLIRPDQRATDGLVRVSAESKKNLDQVLFRQGKEALERNDWPGVAGNLKELKAQDEALRNELLALIAVSGRAAAKAMEWESADEALALLKEAGAPEATNLAAAIQSARASEFIANGKSSLEKKRWRDAITAFEGALAIAREDADAITGLKAAQTGARDERYEAAMKSGQENLKQGNLSAAEKSFLAALQERANDELAQKGLKEIEGARKTAERESRYKYFMAEGDAAAQKKDWGRARTAYHEALGFKPQDADALKKEASAQKAWDDEQIATALADARRRLEAKEWVAAEDAFNKILQLRADDPDAKQGLALVAKRRGEAETETRYQQSMTAGRAALGRREWSAAETSFNGALAVKRDDPDARKGVADAQNGAILARYTTTLESAEAKLKAKDYAAAGKLFRQAQSEKVADTSKAKDGLARVESAMRDEQFAAHMQEGNKALKENRFDDAEQAFARALDEKPGDATAANGRKRAQDERGRIAKQIETDTARFGELLNEIGRSVAEFPADAAGYYADLPDAKRATVITNLEEVIAIAGRLKRDVKAQVAQLEKLKWKKEIELSVAGVRLEMVLVRAGDFEMGSAKGNEDEAPHRVSISRPFYVSKYPVTVEQYRAFRRPPALKRTVTDSNIVASARPSRSRFAGEEDPFGSDVASAPEVRQTTREVQEEQSPKHPVVFVSHSDAREFATWAGEKISKKLRLPTEAEWEYAARGPEGRAYPWGNSFTNARANAERQQGMTVSVGGFQNASWCGAFDMAGNVFQACSDFYAPYSRSDAQKDPTGPASGTARAMRGGSFKSSSIDCLSYRRARWDGQPRDDVGFRLVLPLGGE